MKDENKDFNDELNDDDDNEKFNPEEFFDETDGDEINDEELRKEINTYKELPLFKKAEEIRRLTEAITKTIKEEKDHLNIASQMYLNACMLGAKIAGAEGSPYTLKMENAVLIKIHARELQTQTAFCIDEKFSDMDYLQILRDEIEEFRKLFIAWIKTFDKSDDIQDEWGLFY